MKKVSIIITAKNYGHYLQDCINSCLQQTIPAFEIIYSDDASDDDSVAIAKSLGVKVITHNKHAGVVKARNDGFKKSSGDYLIFVDGDDKLSDDYIERMLEVLDDNTVVCYSIVNRFGDTNEFRDYNCDRNGFLWHQNYINTSALIEREAFIKAGKWKPNRFKTHWDWDLFLRMSRLGKIKKTRAILHYRRHQNSNLMRIKRENPSSLSQMQKHLILDNVKLTVGLVYSGRLSGLFAYWMDNLCHDVKIFEHKPQLIIINNSNYVLDLSVWRSSFSEIKIIKGNSEYVGLQERCFILSTILADAYNTILENATGELIHLREDDNTSEADSFTNLVNAILDTQMKPTVVGGLYMNRHQKRIVGGYHIAQHTVKLITEAEFPNKPLKVDFTGTGYLLFWKDLVPNFETHTRYGEYAHDWAWCLKLKDFGQSVYVLPNAISRHYLTEHDYSLPMINQDNYTDPVIEQPSQKQEIISNKQKNISNKESIVIIKKSLTQKQ